MQLLVVLFGLGAVMAYVFQRLKLPTVLGFILTGVLLGRFNLIHAAQINTLSQIGIIFLLFMAGLELSFSRIRQLRIQAPIAGVLQLGLTTVFLTLLLRFAAHIPIQLAFLLASTLSLSSTAIVLKALEDNSEIDTVHGRLILGILIIQDLSIIPLMTLVPTFIMPWTPDIIGPVILVLLKATAFSAIAVVAGIQLIPKLLDKLAAANRKDIFILAVATLCLGTAQMTESLGLSYEAGAFIAGLALSGSVFCRQIIADIHSFREVFIALFFVSMGLLFDLGFLRAHLSAVLLTTLCLISVKALAAYLAIKILRFPVKTALWGGLSLFQVGEFSFILIAQMMTTLAQNPGSNPARQGLMIHWMPLIINAIVISMFITPLVINAVPALIQTLARRQAGNKPSVQNTDQDAPLPNKVIIAGYGPIARNLATALSFQNIPYVIVEMNLHTIKHLKQKGVPCLYGDISQPDILNAAGIANARMLAVTFPDTRTAELALFQAKKLKPDIYCLARSRYRSDVDKLRTLGANDVIYEELESSIGFVFHVMHHLDLPLAKIDQLISVVRDNEQQKLKISPGEAEHQPVFGRFSLLEGTKLEWIEVRPDSPWCGQTLAEAGIRQQTGLNVVSIIDAERQTQQTPSPETLLKAGDVLVVVGSVEQLRQLEELAINS